MIWHHLPSLFYKIKIVHVKPESQLILQIEESFTLLRSVLGELTVFHISFFLEAKDCESTPLPMKYLGQALSGPGPGVTTPATPPPPLTSLAYT